MRIFKLIFLISIMSIQIACNFLEEQEKRNISNVTQESFASPIQLRGRYNRLASSTLVSPSKVYLAADTLLVIIDRHNIDGQILLFNCQNNLQFLAKTGFSGSGPGEYLGLWDVQSYGNTLWAFDAVESSITLLNIDSIINNRNYILSQRIRITQPKIHDFLLLDETTFIAGYHGREPRFSVFNLNKERLYSFFKYPELPNIYNIDPENFNYNVKANIYRVNLAHGISRRQMVIGYVYTALLQVVDYEKRECVLTVQGPDNNFPPEYVLTNDGRADLSGNGQLGYLDLKATDNFIYGLYSGRSNILDLRANQIVQYDWSGKPIRRYVLDHDIYSFAIDEKNKKIYGIDASDNPLIEYDLPE